MSVPGGRGPADSHITWVPFHLWLVFLFQKRVCTEAEVRSPMDTSQPSRGSRQDPQQVMELTRNTMTSRLSLRVWEVPCSRATLCVAMVTCRHVDSGQCGPAQTSTLLSQVSWRRTSKYPTGAHRTLADDHQRRRAASSRRRPHLSSWAFGKM